MGLQNGEQNYEKSVLRRPSPKQGRARRPYRRRVDLNPSPRNSRRTDRRRALGGLAPFVVLDLLPFRFPFGCGALWTHAALCRFLLALAGFVAVSSALTGALHVRLLTNGRANVLLRRCTGNGSCLSPRTCSPGWQHKTRPSGGTTGVGRGLKRPEGERDARPISAAAYVKLNARARDGRAGSERLHSFTVHAFVL